jgi:adenylate cyclase
MFRQILFRDVVSSLTSPSPLRDRLRSSLRGLARYMSSPARHTHIARVDVSVPAWRDRRLMVAAHADMVGYSHLFGLDDTGTVARINSLHRELLAPMLRQHRGWLAQTAGDSMLMLFDSVAEAVLCAVTVQRQLQCRDNDWPADRRIRLRIGLDMGDVIVDGADFHGDGVIGAARLQAICPPGAICVSRAVHDRGGDRFGLRFEALGALALKNVARPIEALVLRLEPDRAAVT